MDDSRKKALKTAHNNGKAVVYVMSRDQRVTDNHALLFAQHDALEKKVPLIVLFSLFTHSRTRSREHFLFMLDGLQEVARDLKSKNIPFILQTDLRPQGITAFLDEVSALAVYFDFSPLEPMRLRAEHVAASFDGSTYIVDTHNCIPAWVLSDKQEFAAHTLRRKAHALLEQYLVSPPHLKKHPHSVTKKPQTVSFTEAKKIITKNIAPSGITIEFTSGESAAKTQLQRFIDTRLATYAYKRNDITSDGQSNLSPYLHFGQLSSLTAALAVLEAAASVDPPLLFTQAKMAQSSGVPSLKEGMDALFEEMIVRKELSDNFCFYNSRYKSLLAAPDWAKQTLKTHANDKREFVYSLDEWESAQTHDHAWNASQQQLRQTGKIHGYMRMYWAKKLLEWSSSPKEALKICIYLNDKYSIDGGDPNGYANILWSIAGLHDRPWRERQVFGKIRYMNEQGLKRKFNLKAYVTRWTKST